MMSKFDYFVAGRWRNRDAIREVVKVLRDAGSSVYCFIENSYKGDGIAIDTHDHSDPEVMMATLESISDWKTNPTFNHIFKTDMEALKASHALVLVFPSGLSAHMELGAAFGMGKKCYGIGSPQKIETLYLMMDELFPDLSSFNTWLMAKRQEADYHLAPA
jgi:uncharacterized ferredoxin-like protein